MLCSHCLPGVFLNAALLRGRSSLAPRILDRAAGGVFVLLSDGFSYSRSVSQVSWKKKKKKNTKVGYLSGGIAGVV